MPRLQEGQEDQGACTTKAYYDSKHAALHKGCSQEQALAKAKQAHGRAAAVWDGVK